MICASPASFDECPQRDVTDMTESRKLTLARDHLSRAEAAFGSADGAVQLDEGLALLDELTEDAASSTIARNLAATYAEKIFGRIKAVLDTDRGVPQPTLEHFFKLMLAFDAGDFQLPDHAQALKVAVVRRLVELSYEGHSPQQKQAALDRLAQIANGAK